MILSMEVPQRYVARQQFQPGRALADVAARARFAGAATMKLALVTAVVAVGGTLLATNKVGGQFLAAFHTDATAPHYLGYVEGESTLVAPPIAGRLVARPVERGGRVKRGDRLYVIDTTQAEAEVARATATLAEFQARHDNLLTG